MKSREKKPTTFPFSSATKLNLGQDVASSWKENLEREPPERLFCLLFNNPRVVNTWQVILPLIHALKFQVTEVRWFLGDTPDWPSQHGPNLLRWLFYITPFLTSFAKVNIAKIRDSENPNLVDSIDCSGWSNNPTVFWDQFKHLFELFVRGHNRLEVRFYRIALKRRDKPEQSTESTWFAFSEFLILDYIDLGKGC